MPRIHCSVANCHYWKSGNICDASEILVTSDQIGNTMEDRIDAPQSSTINETPVMSCMETCCKTFVQSGSNISKQDGIYRK